MMHRQGVQLTSNHPLQVFNLHREAGAVGAAARALVVRCACARPQRGAALTPVPHPPGVQTSARLGAAAAQLLGAPRVRLYQSCVFVKEPGMGDTNWHSGAPRPRGAYAPWRVRFISNAGLDEAEAFPFCFVSVFC